MDETWLEQYLLLEQVVNPLFARARLISPPCYSAGMKTIGVLVDGFTLKANLFEPATKNGAGALLIHGWESKQDRMFGLAETLTGLGYTCLTIDLRGHGESQGDHTQGSRQEFLRDVVAAHDCLARQGIEPGNVVAIGSSFGAYLCALLSAERPLEGVVLRVPADYRDAGFDAPLYAQRKDPEHDVWKARLHATDETASLRAIHAFAGRVLVVESEQDELVPQTTVQSYADAVFDKKQLTYYLMHGAPHSITKHPEFQEEFARVVCDWLGEQ